MHVTKSPRKQKKSSSVEFVDLPNAEQSAKLLRRRSTDSNIDRNSVVVRNHKN